MGEGDGRLLEAALGAFLDFGFHAASPIQLEAATGLPWEGLCRRYGDKEGLFLAATEQGLTDGSLAALGKQSEVLNMLERLQRVNGNPRLRAIHRQAITRMRTLAENPERSGVSPD